MIHDVFIPLAIVALCFILGIITIAILLVLLRIGIFIHDWLKN